jgi:hypothetical protein
VDPVQGEGKFPIGLMGAGEWGSEDQLLQFGYEGEKYLNEVYEGGRLKPKHWVDVFGLVDEAKKKTAGEVAKKEKIAKEVEDKTVAEDAPLSDRNAEVREEKEAIKQETATLKEEIAAAKGEDDKVDSVDETKSEVATANDETDVKKVESVDAKVAKEINGAA